MDGDSASLGGANKKLEKDLEAARQKLERQTLELAELHDDQTEVEEIRQQLAKAISELEEKNETIMSLSQTV